MENFPNIYEQQKSNRRSTILIIALFILFFCFIGFGFDLFIFGSDPFGILGEPGGRFPFATLGALLFGAATSLYSLNGGAKAVLQSASAYPAPRDAQEYRMLQNVTDEMAIASGLPRPQVYIIPDSDPNAFATGKDPEHSYIAVTEGLLQSLNREELQGVVAHEMSHIKNLDIRLMTVIAALIGGILLLSDWARTMVRFGGVRTAGKLAGRRSKNAGPILAIILVLWIVAVILAPLVSQLLALAVSRKREYLADASGAELTRNPLALANALTKLESAEAPTESIKKGTAHLCIVDPAGKIMNDKEGFVAELFGTHPPITKRIMLLKAMAYQHSGPAVSPPVPSPQPG
jgi:heat shock protein HtpX